MTAEPGEAALAAELRRALKGEVLFDAFSRGRYSTDASIYQIEPLGVVVPRDAEDVAAALAIARARGVPVLPRGGGTSQCGQTVGARIGPRLQQAHERGARGRCRSAPRARAARRGARPAQPTAPARGSFLPRGHLDGQPRHHRRHDRQQQLRRARPALRQHGAQRPRDRRAARRRHRGALCRNARQFRRERRACALSRSGAAHARAAPARGRRDRAALSRDCCAASAATTST